MSASDLECPLCLEVFRDPCLLPACSHTLCRACVQQLYCDAIVLTPPRVNSSSPTEPAGSGTANSSASSATNPQCTFPGVVCPECRVESAVPAVAALTPNYAIRELCERVAAELASPVRCGRCEEADAAVDCLTCGVSLCAACNRDMHSMGLLSTHPRQSVGPPRRQARGMCRKHPQNPLDFYCEAEGVLVCVTCERLAAHRGHTHEVAEEATARLLEEAGAVVAAMERQCETGGLTADAVAREVGRVEADGRRTRREVEGYYDKLAERVERERRAKLAAVDGAVRAVKEQGKALALMLQRVTAARQEVARLREGVANDGAEAANTASVAELRRRAQQLQGIVATATEQPFQFEEMRLYRSQDSREVDVLRQLVSLEVPFSSGHSVRIDSDIIRDSTVLTKALKKVLMAGLQTARPPALELIYRGSRDGMDSGAFRAKCLHQGPTLTVASTGTGDVFGGYSPISWEQPVGSGGSSKQCEGSFVFSLAGGGRSGPLLLGCVNTADAVYDYGRYGPVFGAGGCDLWFINSPFTCRSTPHSYKVTDTFGQGHVQYTSTTLTGSGESPVTDIEVYRVNQ